MQTTVAVVVLLVGIAGVMAQITKPGGCSHDSGIFTCDYRFVVPMSASGFSPPPQRLVIEEVDGTFSSTDFTNFASVSTASFDINYPAQLTIICITGGSGILSLDATSFTGMGYYQEIRIVNCDFTNIGASAFTRLGSVNYFSLEGGTVTSIDADALLGLNVIKDTSLPVPKGELAFIDVNLVPAGLPTGIFSNMTEVDAITLSNSRLVTVDLALFSTTTRVTRINLDNNPFTTLPDNLFEAITALGEVSMAGINWECSCNSLWFLDHFTDNSILLTSAITCTLPSNYYGKTGHKYYSEICDKGLECDGGKMPAIDLGGVTCLTILQLVIYIFAIIGFFGGMAALIMAIQVKRQVGGAGGVNGPAKPGGGPKRGAGNRVSQRPPAGTRPPVRKNAFGK